MMQIDPVIQQTIDELREKFGHPNLEVEAKKISRKLEEAHYNPGNVRLLADCIIALLLAARSQGFSVNDTFDTVKRICEELRGMEWKRMPDGTYQAQ